MLTTRRRQRKQQKKKTKKKNRSNQQKKNQQQQQLCTCSTLFFVHFFAVVLLDDNVKLPKIFQLHVSWTKSCKWSCSLFFAVALFYLGGRQHFSFCTNRYKISCYSSNEIGLLCFFVLSLALAFSLLSTPMQTLKLSRKKESASLLLFF